MPPPLMMRSHRHAVLFHPLQNHARVERRAFDGGEQLVLRRVRQPPAERDAAQFRIHQHGAIAVVPGEPQQSGLAGAVVLQALATARRPSSPARRAIASKISPVAERPASMPVQLADEPSPAPRRTLRESASACSLIAMMQVEVPTTFTTSPSRTPAPMASQCASNAPTGIGMPARSPRRSAHAGAEMAGDLVRRA